jgi:hypothetical protein
MHNYLVYPGVTISSARRIARARISVPGDRQGFDARAVKALNDLADEYDALAALVQIHAEAQKRQTRTMISPQERLLPTIRRATCSAMYVVTEADATGRPTSGTALPPSEVAISPHPGQRQGWMPLPPGAARRPRKGKWAP